MNARSAATAREVRFTATSRTGEVSGLVLHPPGATELLVLAHGAGAGMRHAFMETLAGALADSGIATLRYQFPYVEKGGRRPDPPAVLVATVRAAVAFAAQELAGDLPLFAGGKSMGGRMSSTAAAVETGAAPPLPGVRGLVFFGFPLHAPGSPGSLRAAHLYQVQVPMLFLQGTRDTLADLDHLRPVTAKLGDRATLHVIEGADHSFHVLKRSGRSDPEVMEEMVKTTAEWMRSGERLRTR
jgi:predicted alpha/beta-hydrolase family hydrolase